MKRQTKLNTLLALTMIAVMGLLNSCGQEDDPTPQNAAPTVANALQDLNLEEGFGTHQVNFGNVFTDGDGDALTINASTSDANVVSVNVSAQAITITEGGIGVAVITLTASDGNGGSVTDDFRVAVNQRANTAPTVVNALQDLTYEEGFGTQNVDFANVFTDADSDPLSIEVSSSNESVATTRINGTNLIITEVGVGTSTIKLTAMDGRGGMVSDEFLLTITEKPNNPPTVANATADLTLDAGFGTEMVDINMVFEDADGDALSYSVANSDDGVATLSLTGGVITISEVNSGVTTVTVTADDGNGGTATDEFLVTINQANTTTVTLTFGTNTGNSVEISSWTSVSSSHSYVIVISDASGISDRTNGNSPLHSTTYVGTGQQVIYDGSAVTALNVTLLEDQKNYYFRIFPYTGNHVYDNSQTEQQSTTGSCSTSSTTVSEVCFDINGDIRTITSNQYPSHEVGRFPNADPTAMAVTRNFDLTPEMASSVTYVYDETGPPTPRNQNFWQFGMASNGVEFHPMGLKPWTNPNTGEENWKWQEQVTQEGQTNLDAWGAHVTSQGNYHYHGDIVGLASGENGNRHSLLYGFAADGFPIYYKYAYSVSDDPTSAIKELKSSYRLKSGARSDTGTSNEDYPGGDHDGTYIQDYEYVQGLGDLDECNGRTGVTPEYPNGTYYYVITADFPVTPNCFKGTPDEDWQIGR